MTIFPKHLMYMFILSSNSQIFLTTLFLQFLLTVTVVTLDDLKSKLKQSKQSRIYHRRVVPLCHWNKSNITTFTSLTITISHHHLQGSSTPKQKVILKHEPFKIKRRGSIIIIDAILVIVWCGTLYVGKDWKREDI